MLLKKTNIEEKLQRFKNKTISQDNILRDVKQILKQDTKKEETIINTLKTGNDSVENNFIFDLLETDKIYHINTIKDICIDYRLRFLDTKYFKNDIPYSAITKIKELEKSHGISINGYKIIAPSKLFKLENADDPLLFAPIGNGYYYLIHKWGNDLSPMRKWLMMPFKNFENLVFTTVMVSFLATYLIPDGLFSKQNTSAEFWLTFFFMFKTVGAIVIYYAFASGKNFNTAIWDSKYYNA